MPKDDADGETISVWFPADHPREKAWYRKLQHKSDWLVNQIRRDMAEDPETLHAQILRKESEIVVMKQKYDALNAKKAEMVVKGNEWQDRIAGDDELAKRRARFFDNFQLQVKNAVKKGDAKRTRELGDQAIQYGMTLDTVKGIILAAGGFYD